MTELQMASPTHATEHEHRDRLTGFGDRDKLVADLTQALEPGQPPALVAVFELVGSDDYQRLSGKRASDALIARHAERFARAVGEAGVCYRPRQDEFCALLSGPIDAAKATLFAAEQELNDDETDSALIPVCFGAASLPDEGTDPTSLLVLADQRLRLRMANRKPRERRQTPRRQ